VFARCQLALTLWKDEILGPLENSVSNGVLEQINMERNGETLDPRLVSTVTSSFGKVYYDQIQHDAMC